jgi:hypothetical protein
MTDLLFNGSPVVVPDPSQPIVMQPPSSPAVIVVPVTGPAGPADSGALDALAGHIASPTPHPAYDTDLQSLTIVFENGLA